MMSGEMLPICQNCASLYVLKPEARFGRITRRGGFWCEHEQLEQETDSGPLNFKPPSLTFGCGLFSAAAELQEAGGFPEVPEVADGDFAELVRRFVCDAFGKDEAGNSHGRAARMLEEALELAQTSNITRQEVVELVGYVYSRPPGSPIDELGGTYFTLTALAGAYGVNLPDAGAAELRRKLARLDRLKAKHAARVPGSALPGQVG